MAFPDDPNDLFFRIAFGADRSADPTTWSYTDVSSEAKAGVTITRGRLGEQPRTQPTELEAEIANEDGVFSPRNVTGPHYGQLRLNTPVQVAVDVGAGLVSRGTALVPDWPPQWTAPDTDERIPLAAAGVLSRLGQGSKAKSALFRSITGATAVAPVGYWPLEDGSEASEAAAGIDGCPAGVVVGGTVRFAGAPALPGAAAAMSATTPDVVDASSLSPGNVRFTVPSHAIGDETVTFWTQGTPFDSAPSGGVQVTAVHRVNFTSGALATVAVLGFDPTGGFTAPVGYWVQFFDQFGVFIDELYTGTPHPTTMVPFDGTWHEAQLRLSQSGANIDASIYVDGALGDSVTLTSQTLTPIAEFIAGATGYYQDSSNNYVTPYQAPYSLAHLMVHNAAPGSFFDNADALGYAGETASDRVQRVCDEEGVFVDVAAGLSEAMGPQPVGAILEVLEDCEKADEGFLVERLSGALGFDPHTAYENQAVALTLDYSLGHVTSWIPVDDDGQVVNVSTITRSGGTSATIEQPDGERGSDPQAGADRYPDGDILNLDQDSQAIHHAGYRVHRGTLNKMRFRRVCVDLIEHPELIADWLACDIGSRIQITNGPVEMVGNDDHDLYLRGYQEILDATQWLVWMDLDPYGTYAVFVLAQTTSDAGEFVGRLAEDSRAAIRTAITSTALSIPIDPNVFPWTQVADDFDPDPTVRFGGETATVSGIATTAATFVAVGAASSANNAPVSPAIYAGAAENDIIVVVAALCSTPGTTGSPTAPADYERLDVFDDPAVSVDGAINIQVYVKRHDGSESAPTVGVQDAVAGDVLTAFTFGLRNMPVTAAVADLLVDSNVQTNASATNIAYPYLRKPRVDGCFVLLVGWRQDDYTSIAVPAGFTEMIEAPTTVGNDQGLYAAYQIQTTRTHISNGSLVVTTAGGAAASRAALIALAGGYQTLTVSARSTNGAVKAHSAGTLIGFDSAYALGL